MIVITSVVLILEQIEVKYLYIRVIYIKYHNLFNFVIYFVFICLFFYIEHLCIEFIIQALKYKQILVELKEKYYYIIFYLLIHFTQYVIIEILISFTQFFRFN